MASSHIKLTIDTSTFRDAVSALEHAIEPRNLPGDLCLALGKIALHLFENGRAVKLRAGPAPGTNEMTVFMEPSEAFLGLLSAIRACNGEDGGFGGGHG
jgi:hypothetical protein